MTYFFALALLLITSTSQYSESTLLVLLNSVFAQPYNMSISRKWRHKNLLCRRICNSSQWIEWNRKLLSKRLRCSRLKEVCCDRLVLTVCGVFCHSTISLYL